MRRKGELSSTRVDREWPHQIMVPAEDVLNQKYKEAHDFCADLSFCPRGHSIVKDDKWHRVFCFAKKEDAEKFQARFGGEWFDPALQGRGRGWHLMKKPKQKFY